MKQLFRRLQRRRHHRNANAITPKPPELAQTGLPQGIPSTVVVEPKSDEDATTVSRYTMDSRGHYCLQPDMDEAIVQLAASAIAMATQQKQQQKKQQQDGTINTESASVKENETTTDVESRTLAKSNMQTNNNNENATIGFHETQATLAVEQSNWDLAIFHYEHALQCLSDSTLWTTETLGTIGTILNNLAYASQVVRYTSSDKIIRFYQAALSIKRHVYGKLHESTAKTLNNLGSTHYLNRQFHSAASYYEEARDILRLLPNARHLANEIATISSNLGDVHYCLLQYERANLEYRSSLRLRWNLYAKSDTKITRLLEQIATTDQKIKHHSESQNDEDDSSLVSSGRSRGSWNQEIEQLQMELSVDLEFLDELEHSMPIQMAKDKAVVFRELRNFTTKSVPFRINGNLSSGDATTASAYAVQDHHVVSPDSSKTATHLHPASEAAVQCNAEWTVLRKYPLMPLKEDPTNEFAHVTPMKEESSTTLTKSQHDPLSQLSSTTTTTTTIPVTPPPESTPTRLAAARLRHAAVITSPLRLTQNERQAALIDVKARLAQLRASRKPSSSSMVLV
jgi:tetratricopeptide (TPR) repeat protein